MEQIPEGFEKFEVRRGGWWDKKRVVKKEGKENNWIRFSKYSKPRFY